MVVQGTQPDGRSMNKNIVTVLGATQATFSSWCKKYLIHNLYPFVVSVNIFCAKLKQLTHILEYKKATIKTIKYR